MDHHLSVLALGFLLGMRHATDADHIAAMSVLVARHKRAGAAWLLGAVWGLGHTATIFACGAAIILFKVAIPERAALGMEFAVGLMLVALGALNLSGRVDSASAMKHEHAQLLRSLGVGLVHGLAGSGAVVLLALAAIPDARAAVLYLLIFGAGTLSGMLLLSVVMELSMLRLFRSLGGAARWTTAGTGALSVVFGMRVMYRIGWVGGLFYRV